MERNKLINLLKNSAEYAAEYEKNRFRLRKIAEELRLRQPSINERKNSSNFKGSI